METILHIYHPTRDLLLLEYANKTGTVSNVIRMGSHSGPSNVLLFVGGLYDNFRSPAYIEDIAALFPRDVPGQKWRVMHVQMSSSGKTFGLYDLDRDVEEISTAINYIRSSITRSPTSPVVLMGHSTGCQDLMHYLVSEVPPKTKAKTNTKNNQSTSASASASRPTISGAIFQAPVSDREAIMRDVNDDPPTRESYESCLSIAASTPEDKHATTILPLHVSRLCLGPAPLSIKRFLSLASPGSPENPGMDDYFSSDLTDRRLVDTFGRIGAAAHLQVSKRQHDDNKSSDDVGSGKTVLFLPSGSDEHVPSTIDKALLLSRWKRAIESRGAAASLSPHSQIIPNALHDISGPSVEARTARLIDMRGAVLRYLDDVVGDIDGETGSTAPAAAAQTHPGPWTIYHRDQQAIELERGVGGVRL